MANDATPDPTAQFREMLTQWERGVDEFMNRVMGTEDFSRSMNEMQRAQLTAQKAFADFLRLLASRLSPGSRLAYDFKRKGVADGFGRGESVRVPFRLSANAAEVDRFHRNLGLSVDRFELDTELVARVVPGISGSRHRLFSEDALVQLSVSDTSL